MRIFVFFLYLIYYEICFLMLISKVFVEGRRKEMYNVSFFFRKYIFVIKKLFYGFFFKFRNIVIFKYCIGIKYFKSVNLC